MDLMEAVRRRHAVRSYYGDRAIGDGARCELQELLAQLNRESGLNMQLVLDEPKAFSGFMAHYGKFSGVRNYIALVGKRGPGLDEACGYCGEKAVLKAQQLAPTAMNQQKFRFSLRDGTVSAEPGSGFYTKVDLGIAKCHFEIGAGDQGWHWAK